MFSGFYIEMFAIALLWQALIFAGIFLGIYHNTKHYPDKFIAWFMLANAGYFTITWLANFGHISVLRYAYPLAMPLLLCHLPFFYWYIRALTDTGFRVKGRQILHLVPAIVVLVLQMAFFILPDNQAVLFLEKDSLSPAYNLMRSFLLGINRVSYYLILTAQFIYYIVKYRSLLHEYRSRIEDVFSFKEKIDLRWMRTLMIGILLFFVGNDLAYILKINFHFFSLFFFSLGMLAINFFIGYHALMQTAVINVVTSTALQHITSPVEVIPVPDDSINEKVNGDIPKYKRSALKNETRGMIIQKLTVLMEEEELYTEAQLSIDQVAEKLNVNSKYLSQAINEVYNYNFYNFVNDLRVEKVKGFLKMNSLGHYSIEGIAQQVGFQSKSSFYAAFKKSTGMTPAAYRSINNVQAEKTNEVA